LKILHLTHTDIRTDSRILKELSALNDTGIYNLYGVGVSEQRKKAGVSHIHSAKVFALRLITRSLRWLPSPIRHSLVYIEMSLKVLVIILIIRPKLIHCHDTPLLPIASIGAFLVRSKVIYDAHELESKKNGQSSTISKLTYLLEKCCWGSVDGFITVSESIRSWYHNKFQFKESVLIYNSPLFYESSDLNSGHVKNFYFHEKYNIPKDEKVFVYLGLFTPGRGIESLLEVFSSHKISSHIVFIGRGSLSKKIERYSLSSQKIHIHDAVPHEKVVPLVRNADYGLCMLENISLSDYYSLPNKLFEYAFAGVPVLASDFPDMKELIQDYKLGVCVSNSVDEIINTIIHLEAFRLDRSDVCIDILGWQQQEVKLVNLYKKLLFPTAS
jgi:glycosyltransferase involved in cell wall biosynthesis